jgi:hypothetical protein
MSLVHQDPPPAMGERREGNGTADGRHIHRRRMLPSHSRLALFLSRRLRRTSASGLGRHAADCSARVWPGRGFRGGDGRGGRPGAKASTPRPLSWASSPRAKPPSGTSGSPPATAPAACARAVGRRTRTWPADDESEISRSSNRRSQPRGSSLATPPSTYPSI